MKMSILLKSVEKKIDRKEAVLLLAHSINKTEAYVLAHVEQTISDKSIIKFNKMYLDRVKHKPVAYILGMQPFYGLEFKVNKHVLIPRPETEQLVEMVANNILDHESLFALRASPHKTKRVAQTLQSEKGNQFGEKKNPTESVVIVDIGTGSGCIACSLKSILRDAIVIASDNSPTTLSVVKHNDKKLSTGLQVIHSNLFSGQLLKQVNQEINRAKKVDLHVIANLPYLPYSDRTGMQKDVVAYEPSNALFADDDGMELIKKCMHQLQFFLLPRSDIDFRWYLYFEMDPRQKNPLRIYAKNLFPEAKIFIKKDLNRKERFLIITNRD